MRWRFMRMLSFRIPDEPMASAGAPSPASSPTAAAKASCSWPMVSMFVDMMLAMLHPMNDRARGHKQQRFEEGMGDQVESRRDIGPNTQRRDHEA